jgi:hypothetical protein
VGAQLPLDRGDAGATWPPPRDIPITFL